jgi:hypothetical protein
MSWSLRLLRIPIIAPFVSRSQFWLLFGTNEWILSQRPNSFPTCSTISPKSFFICMSFATLGSFHKRARIAASGVDCLPYVNVKYRQAWKYASDDCSRQRRVSRHQEVTEKACHRLKSQPDFGDPSRSGGPARLDASYEAGGDVFEKGGCPKCRSKCHFDHVEASEIAVIEGILTQLKRSIVLLGQPRNNEPSDVPRAKGFIPPTWTSRMA